MWHLLYTYKVTTKLAHKLYYVADVDYNLIIKFFIIGDVRYPAHARLNVNWNSHVSGNRNKYEQVISMCCIVYHCVSLYKAISW